MSDLRELLREGAEMVDAGPELAQRAESRYRRRRATRAVVTALVGLVVVAGVAAGSARVVDEPESSPVVAVPGDEAASSELFFNTLSFIDPEHAYLLLPHEGKTYFLESTDGGRTYRGEYTEEQQRALDGLDHLAMLDDERGFAWATGRGLYATTDAGRSWTQVHPTLSRAGVAPDGSVWGWAADCPVSDPECVATIETSSDFGASWREVAVPVGVVTAYATLHPIDADRAYLTVYGRDAFWSMTSTMPSKALASPCQTSWIGVLSHPAATDLWMFCTRPGYPAQAEIFVSRSGGVQWAPVDHGIETSEFGSLSALDESTAVVSSAEGVWATDDTGESWRLVLGLPSIEAPRMHVHATRGVGLWLMAGDVERPELYFSSDGLHWERREPD